MKKITRALCFLLIIAILISVISFQIVPEVQAASAILTAADFIIERTAIRDYSDMPTVSEEYGEAIRYVFGSYARTGYQLDGSTSIWRHSGDWWSRVNHFGMNQAGVFASEAYYSHVTDSWSQLIADGNGAMAAYWGWGKYGVTRGRHNVTDNGTAQGVVSVQDYYFYEYLPTEAHVARIPIPKEVAELMESGVEIIPVIYVVNDPGNPVKDSIIGYQSVTVSDFRKDGNASGGEPGKYSFKVNCIFPSISVDSAARATLDYMTNGFNSNGSYRSSYTMQVNGFEEFNAHFSAFPGAYSLHQGDFGAAGNGLKIINARNGNYISSEITNSEPLKGTNTVGSGTWSGGGAIGIGLSTRIYVMYYAGKKIEPKAAYTYVNENDSYINPQTGVVVSMPILNNVSTGVINVDGSNFWDASWSIPKAACSNSIIGITSIENPAILNSKYSQVSSGRTAETQATLGVTINTAHLPITISGAVTTYRENHASINDSTAWIPNGNYPVYTDSSKTGSNRNNFYNYEKTDSVLYIVKVYALPPYNPLPDPSDPVYWANSSYAYAEVKQGMYSDNRATEAWEAMAGVPHDETMYVNAGASAILMAVSRTTAHSSVQWQTTNDLQGDPSLRSQSTTGGFGYSATAVSCSVYSSATHCSNVCNGAWCHGCRIGSCHGSCTGHRVRNTNGTYTTEYYDACHNCSGGACPNHTGSETKPISNFSLYYYVIDSYKYYGPEAFTLNTNFFPSSKTFTSSLTTSLSQTTASMTVSGTSKAFTYNTCELLGMNFSNDANRHYQNEAQPIASFTPQQFRLTDVNGNTYNYLGNTSLRFTGKYDTSRNTIVYTNDANGRKMDSSRINNDSRHLYADEVPVYSSSRTNWMPHCENWSIYTKVPLRGYSGNPSSNSRNTAGMLFYGAGYPLSALLPNGAYASSASPVQWRLQGSGGTNARILPSFDAPTVIRPTNPSVEPTYSKAAGYSTSGSFSTVPNSVIVHSPNALGDLSVSQYLLSGQTYVEPSTILASGSNVLGQHIRLGQSFKLNWDHKWSAAARTSSRGLLELGAQTWGTGTQGYIVGLDTLRWISAKYIKFSFEVIYNGTRYAANTWITVPRTEMASTFHVPISNAEALSGYYEAKVVAYNTPGGPSPNSTDVETVLNITRTSYKAKHGANRSFLTSVLGTIGNFTIQYTTDPNWKDYFAAKYIGTGRNMFGFASNNPVGRYLDPFNTIPLLNKAPASSKPLVPGSNGNINNEPVKMGYPIYYSIQTVGNYKDSTMRVDANYRVVKYSGGSTSYIDVDLYYRDGNSYKKLFPAEGSIVTTNVLNNSTYPVTSLEQSNSISWGGISFSSGNKSNILGPGFFKLPVQLRTLIGYTRDYSYTFQYPIGGNHTLRQHAENAQRWHGAIYLPSSTVAVPRGTPISDSAIIKGDGVMLTCELKFTTEGGSPFNLSTNEGTMYTPTSGTVNASVIPPGYATSVDIGFPSNTVVVFDINKNSSQDAGTSGTH